MHDIPRKDREDADDVDEDEASEVSGGLSVIDIDGIPAVPTKNYPDEVGAPTNPGHLIDSTFE